MGCVWSCISQSWLCLIGSLKWLVVATANVAIWLIQSATDVLVWVFDALMCGCCKQDRLRQSGETNNAHTFSNEKVAAT
ncbi:hypothetical protein CYLTODRAFT_420358 [Cylindrobasidium torrendii FP15055 ss-10]|uniref:Uncharacterized protein n=1 Tax=Cylindrobasidium torrendii FP15055 ss-10 TaxID=1314674 RepID=A0A0D7BI94_9AGAR|nr:hypothetical protein CYLTODRAFT_420358 [Cylindrobasidium torrendii FP15055 ss-10]